MANIITIIRIICSIVLLFCPALSFSFYSVYVIAGFSDMIDGIIARKMNTVSEFGSRLDTLADFVLVVVCMIKLLPILDIEVWMYIWIGIIAIIKLINVIFGIKQQSRFIAIHSVMNKIAGGLLFVLPLTIGIINLRYSIVVVCIVATIAAIEEGYYIRTGKYGGKYK